MIIAIIRLRYYVFGAGGERLFTACSLFTSDDSGTDPNQTIAIGCALIIPAALIAELDHTWAGLLRDEFIPEFHTSECVAGQDGNQPVEQPPGVGVVLIGRCGKLAELAALEHRSNGRCEAGVVISPARKSRSNPCKLLAISASRRSERLGLRSRCLDSVPHLELQPIAGSARRDRAPGRHRLALAEAAVEQLDIVQQTRRVDSLAAAVDELEHQAKGAPPFARARRFALTANTPSTTRSATRSEITRCECTAASSSGRPPRPPRRQLPLENRDWAGTAPAPSLERARLPRHSAAEAPVRARARALLRGLSGRRLDRSLPLMARPVLR